MRAVRLVGLADGGREVVCEDPITGEQFLLARDDKLRAAVRGDLKQFGQQLEIDGDSQLRPREIQARIRAGATVEAVAALAGTSIRRIERFAHPVLLERSSMAERARTARPTIDGIHSATPVEEAVVANLAARGHDGDVSWDAYRDDANWVLVLTWHMGRSINRAQWTFHPGPGGGTLTARDENAADIVDPALRVLRPLREVAKPSTAATAEPAARDEMPAPVQETPVGPEQPVEAAVAKTGTEHPARAAAPRPASRKGNRPVMPSWEDVLLGTRSGR